MSAIATLQHVGVKYLSTGETAITDVSMQVYPGQLILLAGSSGSGKSTVMRVLNGLVPHSYRAEITGEVAIGGRDARELSVRDISSSVGTLLQNPARQVVGHSVVADIAFGLENRGVHRHEIIKRVDNVAASLSISDELLATSTRELSSGQMQLIAFAGVLVMQPRLIIVDEPLANLDPGAGARLLCSLRDFVDSGGAAIVIEHRINEVAECEPDFVVYLEDGYPRYLGSFEGFLHAADPQSVKLPFDALIPRAAELSDQEQLWRPDVPVHVRLSYDNATLGYASTRIVGAVDADLYAGQRVAVLGRNGAGKTTLLRAAVGLVDTLNGRVELEGRLVAGYSAGELAALCGYLFPNPAQALFAGTVREELAFGPRNLKWDGATIDIVAESVLHMVGLSGKDGIMTRPPRTLSFGEQRRLALAIALMLRPSTLILDEPTAGQDERSSAHFLDSVWTLPSLDAVYFITHDVDMALWRSDRVIVVEGGRLLADGTPSQIVHDASLWHAESYAGGRAVLRETAFVRAARGALAVTDRIPPPNHLARELNSCRRSSAS
jgi:energy-coupling factor transport system ATP-binding protein